MGDAFHNCPKCGQPRFNGNIPTLAVNSISTVMALAKKQRVEWTLEGLLNWAGMMKDTIAQGVAVYLVFPGAALSFPVEIKWIFNLKFQANIKADLFYCSACGYNAAQGVRFG